MTLRRAALYIGGASLLVAWFSSAASLPFYRNNPRIAARGEQTASFVEDLGSQVERQRERLRAHLASAPKPDPQVRNPFAFGSVPAPPAPGPAQRIQPMAAAPPPEFPEPVLRLIGVAEHKREEGLVRTALLVGQGDDLMMVTVGDSVLARYNVTAVGADAVELRDLTTGSTRRLVLDVP